MTLRPASVTIQKWFRNKLGVGDKPTPLMLLSWFFWGNTINKKIADKKGEATLEGVDAYVCTTSINRETRS